jgi:hypothetical protein
MRNEWLSKDYEASEILQTASVTVEEKKAEQTAKQRMIGNKL